MIRLLFALLALVTASCQQGGFYRREIRALEGWGEARLVQKYGTPEWVATNTVAQAARSPEPWRPPIPQVLSMYPTNNATNLQVTLRSLSWQHRRIMLTAWLHQHGGDWVAFYVEEWNMDVIE